MRCWHELSIYFNDITYAAPRYQLIGRYYYLYIKAKEMMVIEEDCHWYAICMLNDLSNRHLLKHLLSSAGRKPW